MLERVMIISGESSGELYGAFLARTLKLRNPYIRIMGVGGEKMQSEGVELIAGISGAFGLSEAVRAYKEIKQTFNKVISTLFSFSPQVLILIDYPDFNFRVAKKAKGMNIKILYYVSPQIWAWRSSRINIIKKLVDKIAVILPFEEHIYNKAGVPNEFVGHPVLDEIRDVVAESGYKIEDIGCRGLKEKIRKTLGINDNEILITMMPGSRDHELSRLLPVIEAVIDEFSRNKTGYQFVIPVAPNIDKRHLILFNSLCERFSTCNIISSQAVNALLASDMAVIASGTSTLQAAILGVPMVVIYKLSPLSYLLGRLLIKLEHISLVNILLDKSPNERMYFRIRELLQGDANKNNIIEEIYRITEDKEYRDEMQMMLEKISYPFINKRASLRVAELVENLCRG